MTKKVWIWMFMAVFLAQIAYAFPVDGLVNAWTMDTDQDSGLGNLDLIDNLNITGNDATYIAQGVNGVNNQAWNFTNSSSKGTAKVDYSGQSVGTISFWMNLSNTCQHKDDSLFSVSIDSNNLLEWNTQGDGNYQIRLLTDSSLRVNLAGLPGCAANQTFINLLVRQNATNLTVFQDGIELSSATNTFWFDDFVGTWGNLTLTGSGGGSPLGGSNASIDEVYVWNRPLSNSEIADVQTQFARPGIGKVTLITPTNGTTASGIITNFTYNISSKESIVNTSLYINGTLNSTNTTVIQNATTEFFNLTMTEGDYNYTIEFCDNTSTCYFPYNNFTISVDSIEPIVTWTLPSLQNSTVSNLNLSTNLSVFDTNLFSYHFNITFPNGTVITSIINESIEINNASILENITNISGFGGMLNSITRVCDGGSSEGACVTETVEFFNLNYTFSFTNNILSGTTNTFNFNLTNNATFLSDVDADLIYNGTRHNMTETIGDTLNQYSIEINATNFTDNITFFFEYFFNGNSSNTTEFTQEALEPDIDNCSAFTNRFINFSLKDELNNSNLTGTIEYLFEFNNGVFEKQFNGTATNTSFEFCMNHAKANFTTDITIQYDVTNYDPRTYVEENRVVDNVTDQVDLFSLFAGQSTEITIHVIDSADTDLANVFIQAFRFDVAENIDKLVETEFTDSDGNAIFDLITGSELYSFKFFQAGDLKLETTRFKIFSTTLEYVLSESAPSALAEWVQIKTITSTLVYSNSTNIVTFSFTDSNNVADEFCLNVTNVNDSATATNCSSTLSQLSHKITTFNVTYAARGYARFKNTNNYYLLENLIIDTTESFIFWVGAQNALSLGLIIFLVVSLLALINKNIAMSGAILGVILLSFLGIFPGGLQIIISFAAISIIIFIVINRRFGT